MATIKKTAGRPKGARRLTEGERDVIRVLLARNVPSDQIAERIGRGRATVYNAVAAMMRNGTLTQGVFDLGQVPQ